MLVLVSLMLSCGCLDSPGDEEKRGIESYTYFSTMFRRCYHHKLILVLIGSAGSRRFARVVFTLAHEYVVFKLQVGCLLLTNLIQYDDHSRSKSLFTVDVPRISATICT